MKLELYTIGAPYGSDLKEWVHVARTKEDAQSMHHIEGYGDALALVSSDLPFDRYPDLAKIDSQTFKEIRLNFALDYLPYRYHRELLAWCADHLEINGKLQILTRSFEYIYSVIEKFLRKGWFARLRRSTARLPESVDWVKSPQEFIVYLLYSGGGRDDYFKSVLTKRLLAHLLTEVGFQRARVRRHGRLLNATARAPFPI